MVEGVETADQLEMLSRLGYKEYQGFLFSQPLARDEISKLLFANLADKPPAIPIQCGADTLAS
jgi:EAL domain-containing protein (putative c-di-GMP-specific phosphodiesterase class I)